MTAYLRVRAARGMGEGLIHSAWSMHVTGMTPAPPPAPDPLEAPTGLRISAVGTDFIEWHWNPVAEASGYQVQYSTDDEFTDADEVIDRTADQTSYRRADLPGGMTAYLRVRAARGMGEGLIHSAWSMHVTGMTPAPPPAPDPLEAPTGLRISAVGTDFIEWHWNPVAGGERLPSPIQHGR